MFTFKIYFGENKTWQQQNCFCTYGPHTGPFFLWFSKEIALNTRLNGSYYKSNSCLATKWRNNKCCQATKICSRNVLYILSVFKMIFAEQ